MKTTTLTLTVIELKIVYCALYNFKFNDYKCYNRHDVSWAQNELMPELMIRVLQEGKKLLAEERGQDFSNLDTDVEFPFIDDGKYEAELSIVKQYLADFAKDDDWHLYLYEEKLACAQNFIAPYRASHKTLECLVALADKSAEDK